MFSRAPRFHEKIPDVPGPGSYNPNVDYLESDAHKRGAFLEKTDRFGKEKESEVPGPGYYNPDYATTMDPKASRSKQPVSNAVVVNLKQELEAMKDQCSRQEKDYQKEIKRFQERIVQVETKVQDLVREKAALQSQAMTTDRELKSSSHTEAGLRLALEKSEGLVKHLTEKAGSFASLQRKLDDLEKIHADGKKRHKEELDCLSAELFQSRKSTTDQTDRIAQLAKENETSQSRISDLKKAVISGEKEIQDLKGKLRNADGGSKGQLAFKQNEIDRLQKAMSSVEAQKKEAIRVSEAKLSEAEKALTLEKKKRETTESRVREMTARSEKEAKDAKARVVQLEAGLSKSRAETTTLQNSLQSAKDQNVEWVEQRTDQLVEVQALLERVSIEYGRLASSSISRGEYEKMQLANASAQVRCLRLERKLADREAQVGELVYLIRHGSEEREGLKASLKEAEEDVKALIETWTWETEDDIFDMLSDWSDLHMRVEKLARDHAQSAQEELELGSRTSDDLVDFHRTHFTRLFYSHLELDRLFDQEHQQSNLLVSHISNVERDFKVTLFQLNGLRVDKVDLEGQVLTRSAELATALRRVEESQIDFQRAADDHRKDLSKLQNSLKEEKERVKKMTTTLVQNKMAEEALKGEIESMKDVLDNATRFEAAHAGLLKELEVLVGRNVLAEEEAAHLSRFNAEILGHQNVNQRIYYVDRIRKELADTKQKLITAIWEKDNLTNENKDLHAELDTYKSVALPIDAKPRTYITRVERPPLFARNLNVGLSRSLGHATKPTTFTRKENVSRVQEEDSVSSEGMMTLEELM